MIEFGKTLRDAREAKGLSVAQLADVTHMTVNTINELENEDFTRIPAPIYGRGFVKLYCETVGLDPKPLLAEFMDILNGNRDDCIRERPTAGTAPDQTPEPVDVPLEKPVAAEDLLPSAETDAADEPASADDEPTPADDESEPEPHAPAIPEPEPSMPDEPIPEPPPRAPIISQQDFFQDTPIPEPVSAIPPLPVSPLSLPANMIGDVIQKLIAAQNGVVRENYDLTIPSSEKAIRKAEMLLQKMFDIAVDMDSPSFDENALRTTYKELLITVPRKITDVSAYLQNWNKDTSSDRYLLNVLDEEQKLLQNFIDVYQRQHNNVPESDVDVKQPNILTQNGLTADFPDYREKWEMEDRLCSPNGHGQVEDKRHYMSALIKVSNEKTQTRYDNYVKTKHIDEKHQHLLFHGSETKNWWSIYQNGLSLRTRVVHGNLFGKGLYFAPLARKSLGYTNFQGAHWTGGRDRFGYLALFKVAIFSIVKLFIREQYKLL